MKNEPAFPTNGLSTINGISLNGLTKRDYFAAMAMQGYIASGSQYNRQPVPDEAIAEWSVRIADLTMAQLEKETT